MYGHYFRNIDEKNRVVLPTSFKKQLGDCFFATINPDNILELRCEKDFSLWKNKLLSPNMLNINARKFARILLGNTIELNLDKQNRMLIPEHFIKQTNLTKEVSFVGIGNKVEIWSKKSFKNFQKNHKNKDVLENLAKKLLEDGVEI